MATKKEKPWEWLRKETARIERRDARRAKRKAEAAKQMTLEPVDSAPMQAVTNERTGQPLVLMRGAKR